MKVIITWVHLKENIKRRENGGREMVRKSITNHRGDI